MEGPDEREKAIGGGLSAEVSPEKQYEPPARPVWRFVIGAVFVVVTDWIALILTAGMFVRHPLLQEALYRGAGIVILIAGFHFLLSTLDEVEHDVAGAMGFPRMGALRELGVGSAIGIALVAMAVLLVALGGKYHANVVITGASCKRLAEVVLLLVVGATYEELSFRGYAFQRLVMSAGPIAAIGVFSVWFGAVHLGNPNAGGILSWGMANTVAIGILLAMAYLRTRALWMPIGIHFGWNFALGTVFGLPVSGLGFFAACVHGKATGPLWLSGGNYGLEGSATGFIVILLGFIPVWLLTRHSESRI